MLDTPTIATYEGVEGVYLLAFYYRGAHVPYGIGRSARAGALHYLGWASDVGRRLDEHRRGKGARLTRVVALAGWELRLVRVWPGATRIDERHLKHSHNAARHCPVCRFRLAPIPALVPSPAPVLLALPFPVPAPSDVCALNIRAL